MKTNLRIYLSLRKAEDRSHMEDTLVLDGFDISTFATAQELWDRFQERPSRMIITDRRFGGGMTGLELAQKVRKHFLLPYVYIVVLSRMNRLDQIQEGLAAGVDDYLIKPHNPFQLRSRVMVGLRWLEYIDSLHAKDRAQATKSAPADDSSSRPG